MKTDMGIDRLMGYGVSLSLQYGRDLLRRPLFGLQQIDRTLQLAGATFRFRQMRSRRSIAIS